MSLAMLVTGCAKRASHDATAAPGTSDDGGDELAQLEQQLALREAQLHSIGVATAAERKDLQAAAEMAGNDASEPISAGAPASAPLAGPEPARDRCTQVCEITTAICALEDQICGMVPRHPGEARYQAACDRSNADCQLATEACHACTGN